MTVTVNHGHAKINETVTLATGIFSIAAYKLTHKRNNLNESWRNKRGENNQYTSLFSTCFVLKKLHVFSVVYSLEAKTILEFSSLMKDISSNATMTEFPPYLH